MTEAADLETLAEELRRKGEPYVVATVVRTLASVAAKPGAKAIIAADGRMVGWIGGGCALGAVKEAAMRSLADGETRLISVAPFDQLKAQGLRPGDERDGVEFAKNMCPSRGVVDVFIEPMLPKPPLMLCGSTPVALAIADLAPRLGLAVSAHVAAESASAYPPMIPVSDGFAGLKDAAETTFIVIATQGQGDEEALLAALRSPASYVAFVGSRRGAACKERRRHAPTDARLWTADAIRRRDAEENRPSVRAELTKARRARHVEHVPRHKAASG
jgi:xanthine dehydrogenase accessory factor